MNEDHKGFIVTIITILGIIYPTLKGMLSADTAAIICASLGAIYVVGSVIAKRTPTKKDDKIFEAIGNLVSIMESKKNDESEQS